MDNAVELGQKPASSLTQTSPVTRTEILQSSTFETTELTAVGLSQTTKRHIRPGRIIYLGWNITNSWAAMASTLALTISQGGSVTLIYGILLIFVVMGCSVWTLAELAGAYPTAGGQYHWTSILSPARYSRGLSYTCGIINVFAWISTCAGVAIIVPQQVLAIVLFYDANYVPQTWHYFLIYEIVTLLVTLHNCFTLRRTMWINDVSFALTLTGFFVIMITCLSRSTNKQSSDFVWTYFTNTGGWSNKGVVFLTGIVSPNYMYAGIDGAIHLAEECTNAASAVPHALLCTWIIGFITSFSFAVAMTYSMSDLDSVLSTVTGVPIYEIWHQACRSQTAATVFLVILLLSASVAMVACFQTASRLTWAFARDNALIGSKYIVRLHPRLEVPIYALAANSGVIFIIGCIYMGSSTAFNAFIGTSLILQQVTYAIPAAVLLCRKRSRGLFPANRPFKIPHSLGWITNIVTVAFSVVTLVFYNFPVVRPVKSSNMNYTSAVIGVMALFASINWLAYANKHYKGPRLQE